MIQVASCSLTTCLTDYVPLYLRSCLPTYLPTLPVAFAKSSTSFLPSHSLCFCLPARVSASVGPAERADMSISGLLSSATARQARAGLHTAERLGGREPAGQLTDNIDERDKQRGHHDDDSQIVVQVRSERVEESKRGGPSLGLQYKP